MINAMPRINSIFWLPFLYLKYFPPILIARREANFQSRCVNGNVKYSVPLHDWTIRADPAGLANRSRYFLGIPFSYTEKFG